MNRESVCNKGSNSSMTRRDQQHLPITIVSALVMEESIHGNAIFLHDDALDGIIKKQSCKLH